MKKSTVTRLSLIALSIFAFSNTSWAHGNKRAAGSAVIDFQKGQDQLTQDNKNDIKKLIDSQMTQGHIASVEVAVWSDNPFPARNEDLSKADRDLANTRSDQIANYLKNDLGISNVKTFNMAESSNWLARTFNTDTAELKSVFSKEEAPVMERKDFDIIREKGAPSKAVLVVSKKVQERNY